MNAERATLFHSNFAGLRKTGVDYRRIFSGHFCREIVMTPVRTAIALAAIVVEATWANAALASQGPGAGMGTASHLTQVAMAILVYGASALVVAIGLIGAARRPH